METALRLRQPPLIVANAPLRRPTSSGEVLRRAIAAQGKQFGKILLRQGRIGVGHAIEATLRSVPHWANKQWAFVVMGIGESEYLNYLTVLAQRLRVDQQFAILPPVGYDRVAEYTAGADAGHALYDPIHVNNVHIATASNKIMEYMAAGLPLLVSDTPALRYMVERYRCGLTAKEGAPESIANAVNMLLGDSAHASRLGQAGKRAFEEVFC